MPTAGGGGGARRRQAAVWSPGAPSRRTRRRARSNHESRQAFHGHRISPAVYSRTSAFVHAFFRNGTGIESRDAMAKSDSTLVLPAILDIEPGVQKDAEADVEAEVLALFDECGAPLIRYVGAFGVNVHDTEDVVQDVFLSLFRHVQLGRPRTNLRGWLFRVAHNLALKQRLRTKRRQALETTEVPNAAGPAGVRQRAEPRTAAGEPRAPAASAGRVPRAARTGPAVPVAAGGGPPLPGDRRRPRHVARRRGEIAGAIDDANGERR